MQIATVESVDYFLLIRKSRCGQNFWFDPSSMFPFHIAFIPKIPRIPRNAEKKHTRETQKKEKKMEKTCRRSWHQTPQSEINFESEEMRQLINMMCETWRNNENYRRNVFLESRTLYARRDIKAYQFSACVNIMQIPLWKERNAFYFFWDKQAKPSRNWKWKEFLCCQCYVLTNNVWMASAKLIIEIYILRALLAFLTIPIQKMYWICEHNVFVLYFRALMKVFFIAEEKSTNFD